MIKTGFSKVNGKIYSDIQTAFSPFYWPDLVDDLDWNQSGKRKNLFRFSDRLNSGLLAGLSRELRPKLVS